MIDVRPHSHCYSAPLTVPPLAPPLIPACALRTISAYAAPSFSSISTFSRLALFSSAAPLARSFLPSNTKRSCLCAALAPPPGSPAPAHLPKTLHSRQSRLPLHFSPSHEPSHSWAHSTSRSLFVATLGTLSETSCRAPRRYSTRWDWSSRTSIRMAKSSIEVRAAGLWR